MSVRPGMIVVGVDGGPAGDEALRFAVDEAVRTGDIVEVVTAYELVWPSITAYGLMREDDLVEELRRDARARQESAVARVLSDGTRVELALRVERGEPGRVLVRVARRARLLVVGCRGRGPVRAVLAGSVSRYCERHARVPVVVVAADSSAHELSAMS
jgi:nucleotide-binding universal stress UspA family protein